MKKANLLSRRLQGCLALTFILLMLSACQKDDTFQPLPASASGSTEEKGVPVNPSFMLYEMIKINHLPGRNMMPDYEVIVYNDLNVLFIGRRNTTTLGKKIFTIDERSFFALKDMFESTHLFDPPVNDAAPIHHVPVADLPQVFTSFSSDGITTITLMDNDNGIDRKLYELRIRAEEMLHIPVLVYGDRAP